MRDKEKHRPVDLDESIVTEHIDEILTDDNIDIVIEVMGGVELTKEHLLKALRNGKHVVTANKDLMALHGAELLACCF